MGTFSKTRRGVRCDGAGCSREVARPTVSEALDIARDQGWRKHRSRRWLPAGVAKQTVAGRRRTSSRSTLPLPNTWTYYLCPTCWPKVARFKKKRAKAARAAVVQARKVASERARKAAERAEQAKERTRRAEEESPFEASTFERGYRGPDICGFEWWSDNPVQQHRCGIRSKPGHEVDPATHPAVHRCGRCDASTPRREP